MTEDYLQNIDLNNSYELSLWSTVLLNFVVVVLLLLLFPILRKKWPAIFNPRPSPSTEHTVFNSELLWFIDVLLQPLSVYAQHGTITQMYFLFQEHIAELLTEIALTSLVFLIPTYYLGTDQSFNIRYLTTWSKLNMSHIEEGSSQIFIPIFASVLISAYVMRFYKKFITTYAEMRQKAARRPDPQNYVLLLSNIPYRVYTREALDAQLSNIRDGIEDIVVVPEHSKALAKLYKKYDKVERSLSGLQLQIDTLDAKLLKLRAEDDAKRIKKVLVKKEGLSTEHASKTQQLLQLKNQIAKESNVLAQSSTEENAQPNDLDYATALYVANYQRIGSSVFLVCRTQQLAAQKCNVVLDNNEEHPQLQLAPPPSDVIWENVNEPPKFNNTRRASFALSLIVLFFVYFFVQAAIVNYVSSSAQQWTVSINAEICRPYCLKSKEYACSFCTTIVQTGITYIPMLINCLLMSVLPWAIEQCVSLLPLPGKQEAEQCAYTVLFVYLLLIYGFIYVAFPSTISPETGKIDLNFVMTLNIQEFLWSLGRNLPNCTFVFLNYIVGKYLLFPVLSIFNFNAIYEYIKAKIFYKTSIEMPEIVLYQRFCYGKQLAYINHMFTISLLFALISPFTSIIVWAIFCFMVLADRYQIFYLVKPDENGELSPYSTLMKSAASNVYLGLYFLLVATFAFWLLFDGWMYILGEIVYLALLVFVIVWKTLTDKKYRAVLTDCSLGYYAPEVYPPQKTANLLMSRKSDVLYTNALKSDALTRDPELLAADCSSAAVDIHRVSAAFFHPAMCYK